MISIKIEASNFANTIVVDTKYITTAKSLVFGQNYVDNPLRAKIGCLHFGLHLGFLA